MTKIEWTEKTWNPVTGCTKISEGCKNCYAERMTKRLQSIGLNKYRDGFGRVVFHARELKKPIGWKKPTMIFVCSMSDLFHKDVPLGLIAAVFANMELADWHVYQVLTKRPKKMKRYFDKKQYVSPYAKQKQIIGPDDFVRQNVWLGVSVESEKYLDRIKILKEIDTHVRFISFEPLLGPIPEMDLTGIHWVIVGGESGPGARPMKKEWVVDIRDQCIDQGIPFFFKQWGGFNKKKNGCILNGRTWEQYPKNNMEIIHVI